MKQDIVAEYMAAAYRISKQSPDKSNQNGAVVYDVIGNNLMSTGYNHFPDGVPPTDERPAKYERIAHAEFDACLKLAKCHMPVDYGTVMFCPWAACSNCALAILCSGIPNLYIHEERCRAFIETRSGQNESGLKNWQTDEPFKWLKAGGVQVSVFSGPVPFFGKVKINGMDWSPHLLEFV